MRMSILRGASGDPAMAFDSSVGYAAILPLATARGRMPARIEITGAD
jgi:hypothetical protein